ncbi:MAG: hypothetical protein HUU57_15705 [Bdellovibrio sp.]|nr:hypothetical protein [Bdellovibrio sp.]
MKMTLIVNNGNAFHRSGLAFVSFCLNKKVGTALAQWRFEMGFSVEKMAEVFLMSPERYLACETGWRSMGARNFSKGVTALNHKIQAEAQIILRDILEESHKIALWQESQECS